MAEVTGVPAESVVARELLRPLDELSSGRRASPRRIGDKAATLARLAHEGIDVPRAWVIEARVFSRAIEPHLPRGYDIASLVKIAATRAGADRAARAHERIVGIPLPGPLTVALATLWEVHGAELPWGFAVRSSATSRDVEEATMAGVASTVLGVRGLAALEQAVREVWASLFLPRTLAYLARAGVRSAEMAVIVQAMVPCEAAGVLSTAPPRGLAGPSWPEDERLVSATLGLGAPVVDGAVAADAVRFAKRGGAVTASVLARKTHALVVGGEGVETVEVPEARQRRPALGADSLRALSRVSEHLERSGVGPFDVEFAVESTGDGPRVWVLQARPAGRGGFPSGGDASTVWSRENLGEALPGVATPLTWSIASSLADRAFRTAFSALGCHVPRGARLVSEVHGRSYLNVSALVRIAAEVPGLRAEVLVGASGGAPAPIVELLERQAASVSRRSFLAQLPLTAPRLVARYARLERDVNAFTADASAARRALMEMDLALLPDDGIATTLKSTLALLDRTGSLMLEAASSSIASHLALGALLRRFARRVSARDADETNAPGALFGEASAPRAATLPHSLTGGVRELESAGPGVALLRVAAVASAEPAARERLLSGETRRLIDLPPGPTRAGLERFLDDHGDRALRESELSVPRWREDPSPVLAMLAAALRGPPQDPDRALAQARAIADRELARLEGRVSTLELALVRVLVERSRHFTRLRDRMRAWVTRVLGVVRHVALDVDRRLRRIDPSLEKGSVFFCTHEELIAALSSGRAEVGHLVRLRRAEHRRDVSRPDPPTMFVGRPSAVWLPPPEGAILHGLPASSGVVEGMARVLEAGPVGLESVRPGEIIISRTTDVGISPLFLVAAGVVTELGGALSHAAVVAREYGIPAVVGVPGATVAIRTGERLRVDGDRGLVERLEGAG